MKWEEFFVRRDNIWQSIPSFTNRINITLTKNRSIRIATTTGFRITASDCSGWAVYMYLLHAGSGMSWWQKQIIFLPLKRFLSLYGGESTFPELSATMVAVSTRIYDIWILMLSSWKIYHCMEFNEIRLQIIGTSYCYGKIKTRSTLCPLTKMP